LCSRSRPRAPLGEEGVDIVGRGEAELQRRPREIGIDDGMRALAASPRKRGTDELAPHSFVGAPAGRRRQPRQVPGGPGAEPNGFPRGRMQLKLKLALCGQPGEIDAASLRSRNPQDGSEDAGGSADLLYLNRGEAFRPADGQAEAGPVQKNALAPNQSPQGV